MCCGSYERWSPLGKSLKSAHKGLIFIIVLVCLVNATETCSLSWKLAMNYIVFGQDVYLTCLVCSECLPNMNRMWVGGQNYGSLCLNGESTNPDKYRMAVNKNNLNFNLTIVKFDYNDTNYDYTCACGFQQYTGRIPMEENTFIYPPGLDTIENYSDLKDDTLTVNVTIPRIYPIPIWVIKLNDELIPNDTLITEVMLVGILINVKVLRQIKVDKNSCSRLQLECRQLGREYTILDKEYGECSKKTDSLLWLYVVAGCALCALLSVLVCVAVERYKTIKEKKKNERDAVDNEEKQGTDGQESIRYIRETGTIIIDSFNQTQVPTTKQINSVEQDLMSFNNQL